MEPMEKMGSQLELQSEFSQSQDFISSKLVCKLLGFNTNMWVGIWGS